RVAVDGREVRAILRGRMKRDLPRVVVGDRVRLEPEPGGQLFGIVGVDERRSLLGRRVPEGRGVRPIAANVDQVLVVSATANPDPIPQLIDRLLVIAEANEIPAAVVLNKIDLAPGDALAARFEAAGYPVYRASARTGQGVDALAALLPGRISVVTGPSGAGKSSLLNRLQPGLSLRTAEISARIRRGKQTTVSAVMIPLEHGGYLVDTPGFSEVGIWGLPAEALADCFPEMRRLPGQCRFTDCRHRGEPGCAVLAALKAGHIAPDRYQSYRALLEELESAPKDWE
ncbi:MAG: ribosome small subunit-dependent GTPase A, partial [Gemmatimonadota bacterium]